MERWHESVALSKPTTAPPYPPYDTSGAPPCSRSRSDVRKPHTRIPCRPRPPRVSIAMHAGQGGAPNAGKSVTLLGQNGAHTGDKAQQKLGKAGRTGQRLLPGRLDPQMRDDGGRWSPPGKCAPKGRLGPALLISLGGVLVAAARVWGVCGCRRLRGEIGCF